MSSKGELIKHSSIMFLGMMGVNIFNLLFQAFMGRKLSADEYGILNALLGLLNIFFLPLSVVSAGIGRYASLLKKENRVGDIKRLVLKWLLILGGIGGALSLICLVFREALAGMLHLDRTAPVLITGAILLGIFCRPVVGGALHGLQLFTLYSLFQSVSSFIRLASGILLVTFVATAAGWGLLGHGIGSYAALLMGSLFLLKSLIQEKATNEPLPSLRGYMLTSFVIVLGYAVLMTGDVVVVKHLYPDQAGEYSFAAILGRMVVFIPQAFAMTMFPKVVSDKGVSLQQWRMFMMTLAITLVCTIIGALGLTLLPGLAFRILYGMSDPEPVMVSWCVTIGWVMIPIALVNVIMRFYMALNKYVVMWLLPFSGILFVAGSLLWRGSVWNLIILLGAISSVLLIVFFIACMKNRPVGDVE